MEVTEHPSITINNHTYFGDFTGKDISRAICASFDVRPEVCKQNMLEVLRGTKDEYF